MNKLPTLAELHSNPAEAFKNDQLKQLLNFPPSESWIKTNKMANNSRYLPIDKIEYLLDRIFQEWKVEVLTVAQLFNSIGVTVRLHYRNPINGEWIFHDGVGASPVQTAAGKSAADLGAIKAAAVQMALPSAKSYAIKDACDHIGAIFGRDLNRKDTLMFSGSYSQEPYRDEPTAPVEPAHTPVAAPVAPVQQSFSFNPENL